MEAHQVLFCIFLELKYIKEKEERGGGGGFGVEEVLAHLDPPRDGPKRGEEMARGPPHLKKKIAQRML